MSAEHAAALVCAWLATYFIHSALLLGAAWTATRKLPSRLDGISELIWRAALGLPIASALVQQLIPRTIVLGAASVGGFGYVPPPLAASRVPAAIWIGVATIWILGMLFGLGQLYLCHCALHRQIEGRTSMSRDRRRLLDVGAEGFEISLVRGLDVPFALAGEICLPEWVIDRLSAAEVRAVVAHEAAHVRRHDALCRAATAVAVRSFFFQPLNWVAASRLRELSECICDDEAVAAMESAIPLAAALEAVATTVHHRRAHLALAPAMGAPVSLTLRRMGRILGHHSAASRKKPGALQVAVFLVTAATVTILFAPRITLPSLAFLRYTISAEDPAGRFTVTVEKGRAVGATIAGQSLESRQLRQKGEILELTDRTSVLSLRMTPEGGIKWTARKPVASPM